MFVLLFYNCPNLNGSSLWCVKVIKIYQKAKLLIDFFSIVVLRELY